MASHSAKFWLWVLLLSNLLIKVSHAALTPAAAKLTNMIPVLPFLARPFIPEMDLSGVIEIAGPHAPVHLTPGTRVYGTGARQPFQTHPISRPPRSTFFSPFFPSKVRNISSSKCPYLALYPNPPEITNQNVSTKTYRHFCLLTR
jgi:hypothetical protein